MGDEITRPARFAEVVCAQQLREALQSRSAPSLVPPEGLRAERTAPWNENDPVIQKAYLEQLVECAPEAITTADANGVREPVRGGPL